jgi:protein gp37
MSDTTKIEWCDHSWSPWEGCTKVSPGCLNCYAEARDKRHLFGPESHWGKGAPRRLTKDWRKPVKWNREAASKCCGFCDYDEAEGDLIQQCSKCARRQTVFPSVCDPFDAEAPIELLARFLGLIHDTPNLDWLLLTKRPENFQARLEAAHSEILAGTGASTMVNRWLGCTYPGLSFPATPPPNVGIGTSVEDQTRADQRVPALLKIPARVRFLSVEPLLGEIDLTSFLWGSDPTCEHCPKDADCSHGWETRKANGHPSIDWVIIGGESGRNARPCNVDWVRSIVRQCHDAGVPCFVKQLGARPVVTITAGQAMPDDFRAFSHPKGGDPTEWPEDLRVRQFPEVKP